LKPDYAEAHSNLGNMLEELGRLVEAEASYTQAIALKPDYAEAHYNLGNTLQELGRLVEAEASYTQAIALKPDYAEAHSNLGNTLQELGRLDEAEASYNQAIALQPDLAKAHSNLGNTLQELGRLDEAEASCRQAIALKPDFAEAHSNLGITLQERGRLEEALASYTQATTLKPDFAEAHSNLGNMLEELGRLEEATNIYHLMLTTKSEYASNVTVSPVIALLPFGRAGSLFFHSLFDGHPEVATLPGVYFKGWFGIDQWRRFAPDLAKLDWREHLIAKVVKEYQPFFNASCKNNVAGKPFGNSKWLAKTQGFTNMGPDQSQTFVVDQKSFSDTFLFLLKSFSSIGIQECFELIHRAFEISVRGNAGTSSQKSSNIFYHIHNPDSYEYAHFLKHYPQARSLHIIRNPVQSMESWMLAGANLGGDDETNKDRRHVQSIYHWPKMVNKIVVMFKQLQSPFNVQAHSRGVRLEDVKRNAHDVMPKIAAWIGIPDHPAIYESSFCGFQYWGPSSKGTGKITGFDTKAIDLPTGRLFGSRDILIFETLFWPLSYQYGYTQLETAEFRRQLMEIRPWLAEPLEFERQLYDELSDHSCALEELTQYTRLHNLLSRLWETLYRNGTYCNMVKPLKLAD
jgi:tetratricopeptide (TPR) repeat protein